jgi:hypothetical protein
MACALTSDYVLDCTDGIGGIKEVKFIELANIASYTESSGTLTAITKNPATVFRSYALIKQTSTFTDTLTVSEANGSNFSAQVLKIVLNKMQASTRNQILLLSKNRVAAVVKDRNGKNWALGIANGLTIKTTIADPGTAMGDRNGYTLEFEGAEPVPAYEVDAATYTSLTV